MREKVEIVSHLSEHLSSVLPELAPCLEVGDWKLEVGGWGLSNLQPLISNIQSPNWLPGLRRAGPSTPLDKSVQIIKLLRLIVTHLEFFVKVR